MACHAPCCLPDYQPILDEIPVWGLVSIISDQADDLGVTVDAERLAREMVVDLLDAVVPAILSDTQHEEGAP